MKDVKTSQKWLKLNLQKPLLNSTLGTITLSLALFVVFLLLFPSCNPLSGTDVLQGSDTIDPLITITSPADGDPYSATVTVTGSITDAADADGSPGQITAVTCDLAEAADPASVTIGTDGSFSADISTTGKTGTITITITATDWNNNTATETLDLAAPKEITYFAFLADDNAAAGLSEDTVGLIDGTDITVSVPDGTDVRTLVAVFETTGVEVNIGNDEQESGETVNNFTESLEYTVTANDATTKTYTITAAATPLPPTGLDVVGDVALHSIVLSWTDNSHNETGFILQRKGSKDSDYTVIAQLDPDVIEENDASFSGSPFYTYRVAAQNEYGLSPWTSTVVDITPGAPVILFIELISATSIGITWEDTSTNEEGFLLQRRAGESDEFLPLADLPNDDAYEDSGLSAITDYTYRIRAYNDDAYSAWVETDTVTTPLYWLQNCIYTTGDFPENDFGQTVSLDDDLIITGAPATFYDDHTYGKACAYKRDPGTGNWNYLHDIVPGDPSDSMFFGTSASVDGDYAFIGAPYDDDNGTESGSVYVFKWDAGSETWGEVDKLVPAEVTEYYRFGYAVAVSGDYALLGAPYDDAVEDSGAVYVYKRDSGQDTWSKIEILTASDAAGGEGFGNSIDMYGDYAVIGADSDDDDGSSSGSAYVFKRDSGLDTWSETDKLLAGDGASNDRFGGSVAVYGDFIAIGAHQNDGAAMDSGAVYIFKKDSGLETWSKVDKVTPDDVAASDWFGSAVEILGDILIIGSMGDDDLGNRAGSGYVFQKDDGADTWSQVSKIVREGMEDEDFGCAIDADGDYLIIGARKSSVYAEMAGAAYVFEK